MARRSKENAIDWDAIHRQYRLGTKTNLQLANEFGIEASTLGRKAKRDGWVQDKTEDVGAVANTLLIQAVSGNANPNATPSALEVKAAGQAVADVVLGHRKGLGRLGAIRDKLLGEVEVITDNLENFERLGEMLDRSGEDDSGKQIRDKLNETYRAVISMSERIDNVKKLAEIDEKVRKGEREAFGVDKVKEGVGGYEDLLAKIGGKA